MEDAAIVELYWQRSEEAIPETERKYGKYCGTIAQNICHSPEDAEECVNDTWLRAWNAMPPNRPSVLSAFFGKITRNLSFDRYKMLHRKKRGSGQIELVLDELEEVVSGSESPEGAFMQKELAAEINRFLNQLPKEKRVMFVLRYWFAESIPEIARRCKKSENNVSVSLNRVRRSLKTYLTERGYSI